MSENCSVENCKSIVHKDGKCILHCDKSDWNNEEFTKEIILFWKEIRKKIKENKSGFINFNKVVFPRSEELRYYNEVEDKDGKYSENWSYDFYEGKEFPDGIDRKSIRNLEFIECIFLEKLDLSNTEISRLAFNTNTVFEKGIDFNDSKIENLVIDNCIFNDKLEIENCNLVFSKGSPFNYNYAFQGSTFEEDLIFNNVEFGSSLSNLSFKNVDFKKQVQFYDCSNINQLNIFTSIKQRIYIIKTKINNIILEYGNINFLGDRLIGLNTFIIKTREKIKYFALLDTEVKKKIVLNKLEFKVLKFEKVNFLEKVELQSKIDSGSFYNSKFQTVIDLEGSTFQNKINFERTSFNNVVFTKTDFKENVDFKFTNFEGTTVFKDAEFKKGVNLEDSNITGDINFFRINKNKELKNLTRETARIIKNSFEQQNNIIEANRFYAIEMEKRENELNEEGKLLDWLVFKFHGLSSNHSQNWIYPLFWIFIVGMFSSTLDFFWYKNEECVVYYFSMLHFAIGYFILFITYYIFATFYDFKYFIGTLTLIVSIGIYLYLTRDFLFYNFSNTINPFSVMRNNDPINIVQLFSKVIIAYLIYQFIISIRQNTRRK